jgi:hypothetical protein
VPVVAVCVAAAIGIGYIALKDVATTRSARHEMSALSGEIASLRGQLVDTQRALVRTQSKLASLRSATVKAASAGNVAQLSDSVDELKVNVHMLQVCVPQLRAELEGLKLQTGNVNGWLTGALLLKPVAMSAACQQALSSPGH